MSYKMVQNDINLHHAQYEDNLWNKNEEKVKKCISVKKLDIDNKCVWKLFEDEKCSVTIDGKEISPKIKKFLHTYEGLNFLIMQYKNGCNTFEQLKKAMVKYVKNNSKK